MTPSFKCNTSTYHTKETSRNGERYFVLRNENFQMPNVRHQKQRIKSLSIKACTREKVQQNCYLEGVVNVQSKTLEEKFLRCHSAQAVLPQGHSNPSAHMPGHIKLF